MGTKTQEKKTFFESLWDLIGIVRYEDEEMDEKKMGFDENRYEKEINMAGRQTVERELGRRFSQDVNTVGDSQFSMKLIKPKTHVEAQIIIDCLKIGQPVIVNLEDNDVEEGQRVMDFVSGAAYSLGGEVKFISKKIFAIVPDNISIAE